MARDKIHNEVKQALENDGWEVTNDPLNIKTGNITVQIDLGAERLIGAQKGSEKIAVEVKTFSLASFITALYEAVGKYIIYRKALKMQQSERTLYLAVPIDVHERFKEEPLINGVLEDEQINTMIYNQFEQKIEKWTR
jgi:hypothetical protein